MSRLGTRVGVDAVAGVDLHSLVEHKVEAEIASVLAEIANLRQALDGLEVVVRLETERRVANAVLSVLGGEVLPEVTGAEEARHTCAMALRAVYVYTSPQDVSGVVVLQSQRSTLAVVGDAVGATSAPVLALSDNDVDVAGGEAREVAEGKDESEAGGPVESEAGGPVESESEEVEAAARMALVATPVRAMFTVSGEDSIKAEALLKEIADLSAEIRAGTYTGQGLHEHLQALAAETRALMLRVPSETDLYERLSHQIATIGTLKRLGGSLEYIKGLSFGSTGDWDRIAKGARARLTWARSRKEREATKDAASPSLPTGTSKAKVASAFSWPALPRLRAVAQSKPIVMVGGKVVKEKIALCLQRFGVVVEWVEVEDAQRSLDSVVRRVRSGSVAAVLLLSGFVPHKTNDAVVDAAKASGTPIAMVDRGGTASIATGLDEVEKKLGG